jgi:co-chaperonin GroES (HSP10)
MNEQEHNEELKKAIWPVSDGVIKYKAFEAKEGPKATGTYVWIIRDEIKSEQGGLLMLSGSREKPHTGTIHSYGDKITDEGIKTRDRAIFHKGIGQEIEYGGVLYLILQEHEIIGTDD